MFSGMGCGGIFEKIWAKGLEQYDKLEGIGWEWQSVDGSMVKSTISLGSSRP